jgi:hypothetical protein
MQEFLDGQEIQLKKLSNFDLGKEQEYKRLSVYNFLFHLWTLDKHISEMESNNPGK